MSYHVRADKPAATFLCLRVVKENKNRLWWTMTTFVEGDRVHFVAGSYKGRKGTYLSPAGVVGLSARVKVDADTKPYRSIRWTSFQKTHPIQEPPLQTVPNVTNTNPILEEDRQAIIAELEFLERRMAELRIRLENP
jgi:hypothetical protein